MPCLFLENIPDDHWEGIKWNKQFLQEFFDETEKILGTRLEVHIRNTLYNMLTPEGETDGYDHGVHGWIYMHEGRTVDQKQQLGDAVQKLLDNHNVGEGLDLTFMELPKGQSFYFGRQIVVV